MTRTVARQRLIDALTMALVTAMSLLLLVYVGFGEAKRSYEEFYVDKLAAQNKMLASAIESFLRRDLPLQQYVGFVPRAKRLLSSDELIAAITVFDANGLQVFSVGDSQIGLLAPDLAVHAAGAALGAEVRRDGVYLQIVLPLANRYEQVGSLTITMPQAPIGEQVEQRFRWLVPVAAALPLLFGVFIGFGGTWLGRQRLPIRQIAYGGLFVLMSVLVVSTLVGLYVKGTQIKTKALADSLAQRMTEVVGFNLEIEQIPGLDRAFSEYRKLNPDIAATALIKDGEVIIHTDPYYEGRQWKSSAGVYEYLVDITPPDSTATISVAVTLPHDIVYWRALRSIKNFAALFIASAFLASVFLQLAGSVQSNQSRRKGHWNAGGTDRLDEELALTLVKPVFYVAMCVEHLSYAFLPQHIEGAILAAGLPSSITALVFTVYYLCFAVTLMPAGHIAERFSPRLLMIVGLTLTACGFVALLAPVSLGTIVAARAAAGIGQAMLFIGVQSYILMVTSPTRKTQGAAIIVYGFQGGMISGMAIGSLIVVYIQPVGVFALGAIATLLMAIYTLAAVPRTETRQRAFAGSLGKSMKSLAANATQAVRSPELLQTIALIGIPAKAVLTGVIVFALPLMMAERGYRQEDIGQILMIYAAGVVLANAYISELVDRTGATHLVIFSGALLSGIGLGLISLIGIGGLDQFLFGGSIEVALILAGVLMIGAAHGLINAPIVTHVASLEVADRIGLNALTAAYRFLERIGHVAGPLVVGQLLLVGDDQTAVVGWIGAAVSVLAIAFLSCCRKSGRTASSVDRARSIGQVQDVIGLHIEPPYLTLVLRIEDCSKEAADDPVQTTMLTHLTRKGQELDARRLRAIQHAELVARPGARREEANERRRDRQFGEFIRRVKASAMPDDRLLVVAYHANSTYRLSSLLADPDLNGRVDLYSMATARAWIDQTRGWLAAMSVGVVQSGDRDGLQLLARAISRFTRDGEEMPRSFIWLNTGSGIVAGGPRLESPARSANPLPTSSRIGGPATIDAR